MKRRRERIRKTPDRPRPEFLVLRLKIEVMHATGEMLWSFESALDERLVDDHLGRDIRQFTSLPGLHLLSHMLEVALHSVHANRNAVDERERLRVFCKHWGKHTWNNVANLTQISLLRALASLFESLRISR